MMRSRCRYLLAVLSLGSPALAMAGEPHCDTFITSVPYMISVRGHYCLANDVAYSSPTGAAITIDTNSVVFDLRGYKIGGQAAGPGMHAFGIDVLDRSNVVVRNGLIRGFLHGIEFDPANGPSNTTNSNNLIKGIRADGNTRYGIYFVALGVNNIVRDCIVGNTGGTTMASGPTVGIWIETPQGAAFDNTITGTQPISGGTDAYGLIVGGNGLAVSNQVIGNGDSGQGNVCFGSGPGAIYKDNIASGCGVAYQGPGNAVGTTNYP